MTFSWAPGLLLACPQEKHCRNARAVGVSWSTAPSRVILWRMCFGLFIDARGPLFLEAAKPDHREISFDRRARATTWGRGCLFRIGGLFWITQPYFHWF